MPSASIEHRGHVRALPPSGQWSLGLLLFRKLGDSMEVISRESYQSLGQASSLFFGESCEPCFAFQQPGLAGGMMAASSEIEPRNPPTGGARYGIQRASSHGRELDSRSAPFAVASRTPGETGRGLGDWDEQGQKQ